MSSTIHFPLTPQGRYVPPSVPSTSSRGSSYHFLRSNTSRRDIRPLSTGGAANSSTDASQRTSRPTRRRQRVPIAQRAVQLLLNSSQVPTWSYLQQPRTPLHYVDARIKQLWLITLLVLCARAAIPFKLAATGVVIAVTAVCLPQRLWKAQLTQLLVLGSLLFLSFALGTEVAPTVQERGLPPAVEGIPGVSEAVNAGYSYLVAKLGPFAVTRRSLRLGVSAFALTVVSLQGASLCLVTSTAEELGNAIRWALSPLRWVGLDPAPAVMTLMLSLRFIGVVFGELHNVLLGLASRGIDWARLGFMGTLELLVTVVSRMFSNLINHSSNIALSLAVRGVTRPGEHELYLERPFPSSVVGNIGAIVLLGGMVAASVLL